MLPKARVVYCSATGVTDIGNLAYATRLGLWGPHSPFSGFKEFKESMEKRGLGALEMLAMELKAKGSYVSRGLGWKGAEFETCQVSEPKDPGFRGVFSSFVIRFFVAPCVCKWH